LKELSMGDAEFEQAIIRQFIVQVPEELELLKDAIDKSNLQRIKSLAHGMKSSIAYLGLGERLNPCLQRMETEAVLNNPDPHFNEDFAQLAQVCNQALAEAKQLQLHSA
jgi:HPt (histidine-containing phosphotransfer) domain-containing protein